MGEVSEGFIGISLKFQSISCIIKNECDINFVNNSTNYVNLMNKEFQLLCINAMSSKVSMNFSCIKKNIKLSLKNPTINIDLFADHMYTKCCFDFLKTLYNSSTMFNIKIFCDSEEYDKVYFCTNDHVDSDSDYDNESLISAKEIIDYFIREDRVCSIRCYDDIKVSKWIDLSRLKEIISKESENHNLKKLSLNVSKEEIIAVYKILRNAKDYIKIKVTLEDFSDFYTDEQNNKVRSFDVDISKEIREFWKYNKQ